MHVKRLILPRCSCVMFRRGPRRPLTSEEDAVDSKECQQCDLEEKGTVQMHAAMMVDLDAFQKSTPYVLVTEWIIPRYTGSRLICR